MSSWGSKKTIALRLQRFHEAEEEEEADEVQDEVKRRLLQDADTAASASPPEPPSDGKGAEEGAAVKPEPKSEGEDVSAEETPTAQEATDEVTPTVESAEAGPEDDKGAGKRKTMASAFAKILGKKSKASVPILSVSARLPRKFLLAVVVPPRS